MGLQSIVERMAQAARRSHGNPQDITLVAVTKTVSFERIRPILEAGIVNVGENRVQEAIEKYGAETDFVKNYPTVKRHLIGYLQSNKAKKTIQTFDMIQSLDRIAIAQDLNRHAEALGKTMPCLVEVKISEEENKTGLPVKELFSFLDQRAQWPALNIMGLMGVAPAMPTAEEVRPYFARLRALFEKTKLSILSMGMSHDFEVAIEEGSTMIRVGSALFGERRKI